MSDYTKPSIMYSPFDSLIFFCTANQLERILNLNPMLVQNHKNINFILKHPF